VTASLTIGGPLFKPPRALTDPEIRQIIAQFTSAARIAAEAGFAGVQIHAAHGYLLSQFLSPLVNQRTDQWGGSVQNRMRMLIEVLRAVKSLTPEAFLLTVKMNVSDCQSGGFDADDALIVAQAPENEGVHLIEFSGGTPEVSLAKPQKVGNNIDHLFSGAWYQEQIARLGRGKPTLPSRKPVVALAIMLATMLRDRLIVRIPRLASRVRT
jgi:2,4-dienoyl-CoA reductase-like NADH-dependent reductase (Old Yellow Enzyme family)